MSIWQLSTFRGEFPGDIGTVKPEAELSYMRSAIYDFVKCVPAAVLDLKTEAALLLIVPWFMRSLTVAGDVCEFGCYRGTMSVKFAYALKASGRTDKTVYAFDTFEGFHFDDPSGGALVKGSYRDNDDAFAELTRWGAVLPVKPVKGDARETCRTITRQLSFVWLDLDFDVLMAPVLDTIWPYLQPDTIIGIDDVGRPETPSVLPWVDRIVAEGRLIELERDDLNFIRFFRANKH